MNNLRFQFDTQGHVNRQVRGERNDCTVRSIATATGVDYITAHRELGAHGRKSRGRFRFQSYVGAERIVFGHRIYRIDAPHQRLVTWAKKYTEGTFIVRVGGHVFTVIDGHEIDIAPNLQTRIVFQFWEVTKIEPKIIIP